MSDERKTESAPSMAARLEEFAEAARDKADGCSRQDYDNLSAGHTVAEAIYRVGAMLALRLDGIEEQVWKQGPKQ